ncbi:uncharacterized protein LOC102803704 [Saccoglossus kowalevskii]|uniref:Uncharacterized protein LOC102803704 n=1 Tax=Saccoglossus kowalevskii TaxID=10224 RepID=A0ABM0MTG2_SACKO|nr:PREDICTED: uncharacterized protein LOC102803704 [Saccoglossus kowalevskii]
MKHTPIVLLPLLLALAHFGGAQTLIYKDDLHEAGTRFVTRDVQIVSLEEKRVFVASTCKQFAGSSANVTVLLNNNPMWLPNAGIVNFYVVDDPAKPESAALCSNIQSGQAVPYCLVPHWNSTNDIYVIATAGRVFAVTFTMTIRISPKQSKKMTSNHI